MKLPPMARTFNWFFGVMNSIVRYIFSGTANFYIRQFAPRDWQYVGPSKIWLGNIDNGDRVVYWVHIFFFLLSKYLHIGSAVRLAIGQVGGEAENYRKYFRPKSTVSTQQNWNWRICRCNCAFHEAITTWLELTHWGRDKMSNIFQTTFWNAFPWIKIF